MKKKKDKKGEYHSFEDFQQYYFPNATEKHLIKMRSTAQTLGSIWAKESLEKIKKQLTEKKMAPALHSSPMWTAF